MTGNIGIVISIVMEIEDHLISRWWILKMVQMSHDLKEHEFQDGSSVS